jgi:hypothetical protein
MRLRAAAAFAAIVAAGDVVAQDGARSFSHAVSPRGFAEECFELAGGKSIGYGFESSAPVDFNIHFHRGNDVVYPARADAVRRADERFTAPSTEEFCLMWTNRAPERVTVKGRFSP